MPLKQLISQAEIAEIVTRLAHQIDQDYQGRSPLVIGILNGSMIFLADLVRSMATPIKQIMFIHLSSYGSSRQSSGKVTIKADLPESLIRDQDLLIVEDIVDTGNSWAALYPQLLALNPRSIKICTLLDKPCRRQIAVSLDYVGHRVEDGFIVGYGLDWKEQYRQLPDIYQWRP
ncbi:MAG: hypothetical protein RLZZ490_278 [Cyanobacteriota bacterium]|jgi:hypoxanthine phosphoribosyltransferase